jgi:SAM-dependent methyltransferase
MFCLSQQQAHMARAFKLAAKMPVEGGLGQMLLADLWDELALRLSVIKRSFAKVVVVSPNGQLPPSLVFEHVTHIMPHWHTDAHWPFAPQSLDLVISVGVGHWLQDWPGWLAQVQHSLKPDGLLVGCLAGGETLWQLRQVLQHTELELCGGASPRISPMVDLPTLAALMQRTHFALPVVDSLKTELSYKAFSTLVADLRAMGQTAAFDKPRPSLPRQFWPMVATNYAAQFGPKLPVTFEWLWFLGWAPSANQPQAKPRGSARVSLVDILK